MNRPLTRHYKDKDDTYCGRFDHMAESLVTIDAKLLAFPVGHKANFVPAKSSICIEFMFKKPHRPNNIHIRWSRDKNPRTIFNQCIKFILHCIFPMRVMRGLDMRFRNGRKSGRLNSEAISRFCRANFRACDHGVTGGGGGGEPGWATGDSKTGRGVDVVAVVLG
ncbi:hypothetical protein Tco_1227155 [Tanacetum coccineum]